MRSLQSFQKVSVYSLMCLRSPGSRLLRGHAIFENIKLHFLLLFCLFFTFSEVKEFHVCQRSRSDTMST